MSIILDTSHSGSGPCRLLEEQSPMGNNLRHASKARLSSALEENVAVAVHTVRDIDPDEPVNMSFLLAFELTQAAPQSFWLNDTA